MERTRKRATFFVVAGLIPLVMATFLMFMLNGARAETGMKALILASSVSGGATSAEATEATGNGFAVTLVDDVTWGAMTATQFSDYQLIVVGDATCSSLRQVVSQNATALADAVMARVGTNTKAGNRILIGTDPRFHYSQGGNKLIETGIDFAGFQEGASGLYLTFSCTDPDYNGNGIGDGQEKLLPLLTADPVATWTQNRTPPCGASASLIANADQFATLTSANLQGWFCSVHETFPTSPTDWSALAVATDTPSRPTCGRDVDTGETACGEAYILIAGTGIVVEAPNLDLDPPEATNPTGTSHTVTATVTNPDDSPRSGVVVSFVVTGANAGAAGVCAPPSCTTGADGKVTFTYTGTNVGDDTINAQITVDGSRQSATAAKTWVEAPKGSVKGKGSIQTGKAFGRATFEVDAGPAGGIFYGITGNGNTFEATSIEAFAVAGNTAGFSGNAKVNGAEGCTYAVRFVDNGTPGREDTINIVISCGGSTVFSSGGPQKLKTGNVVVDDGVVD